MGVERVVLLLQDAGAAAAAAPIAYLVHAGEAPAALACRVAETLRDAGHARGRQRGGGSFKSQMKKADASGARFAVIVGDDEAAAGKRRRQAAARRAASRSPCRVAMLAARIGPRA